MFVQFKFKIYKIALQIKCNIYSNLDAIFLQSKMFIFVQLEMFRQTAAYSFQPPDRPGFRCHQIVMIVKLHNYDDHDDNEVSQ